MAQNDNLQVSFGIQGMERTSQHHLIDEKSYTFARNANLESDIDTIGLTNEHSNLLCSTFKPGFVVIGTKYDQLRSRIWFFITQKDTYKKTDKDGNTIDVRDSEIGWIDVRLNYEDESDLEENCDCDIISYLNQPLEKNTQIEICNKYTTFLEDSCNNCLNFDPNHPVYNIEIKQEATGSTLTFATKNSHLRYVKIDDADYYKKTGSINCGEDNTEVTCLDCDKLRVFPLYLKPHIYPETISYGGNLRRGGYEFYIAYSDKVGNQLSPYLSATNQIDIFDLNNVQLNQATRFDKTPYSIKLTVTGLDPKFEYYKVAVIEKTGVNENVSAFIEGVHSINDTNIIYSQSGLDSPVERISINEIFAPRPVYKSIAGITSSNGFLIGYDYKIEKQWNLQPMVNLLGSFLKWQTVEASENLYKDGVNTAMYRGYMRDEVYPFGIRFFTDGGYTTPVYPLVGRPPVKNVDLKEYSESSNNRDIKSIYDNVPECSSTDRKYHWQFYNTASVLENSYSSVPVKNGNPIEVNVTEDCIQKAVKTVGKGAVTLPNIETFFGLQDYIDAHYNDICGGPDADPDYFNSDLCAIIQDDTFSQCEDIDELFPFPICVDPTECLEEYCNPESQTYDENICANMREGIGYCYEPTLDSQPSLRISEVINEVLTFKEKRLANESGTQPLYEPTYSTNKCMNEEFSNKLTLNDVDYFDDDGNVVRTEDFLIWGGTTSLKEDIDFPSNTECGASLPLPSLAQSVNSEVFGSIQVAPGSCSDDGKVFIEFKSKINVAYHPNMPSGFVFSKESLLTDITAPSVPGYENRILKNALWYKIEFNDNEDVIFEITPVRENSKCKRDTSSGNGRIRYTIFDKCNASRTIVKYGEYDSKQGLILRLKKSELGNKKELYIALDTKIKLHQGSQGIFKGLCPTYYEDKFYMTESICGCFDVKLRDKEYYEVDVKYDAIIMDRVSTYSSTCMFDKPSDSDCGIRPNVYGTFSYWESTEEYPDNSDLYDSSDLKLKPSDLTDENLAIRDIFEKYYVSEVDSDGFYKWKNKESGKSAANFVCEPIRHFKFPDNSVIPFMTTSPITEFSNSKIYPLGITINEKTVEKFLDAAVRSELITAEQRRSIKGYEIFRGDRINNRSIVYKGILNDMYEDPYQTDSNQRTFFRNFPYNTLGDNAFLTSDSERKILINHPYSSTKNDRFSLIAPEVYHNRVAIPTEMTIDGYMYGSAMTSFSEVLNHSEWVLLGEKAYDKAGRLATYEVLMEVALNVASMTIEAGKGLWAMIGVSSGSGAAGSAVGYAALGVYMVSQVVNGISQHVKYKTQWLDIFDANGNVENFAYMQVSSKGYYNYFKKNVDNGNRLRGIATSRYLNNGLEALTEKEGSSAKVIVINNKDRENSVYLSLGSNFPLEYPTEYIGYDNYSKAPRNASRSISSDNRCENNSTSIKRIASPYVSLKNYVPSQYGKIDEIKWLSLNHDSSFNDESKNIFGGDIFISRVDLKNKFKLFNKNAVDIANRTPFKYSTASNIGYARFYIDYKSETKELGLSDVPYLGSGYNLDCKSSRKEFYESTPSKFYLFSYGVPYFLIESEINSNFRYAGNEYHEEFASRGLNVEDWVQEKNVPIAQNNIFNYNEVYSRNQSGLTNYRLNGLYDKNLYDKLADVENGVIWSAQDNSETSLSNPWLTFKNSDNHRFPTEYGRLISVDGLESNQIMVRLENNMLIYNSVDVLKDRITPENSELTNGSIFRGRPVQFSNTKLGETGSQHKSMVSCEFGRFWTDAKRGKIFQLEPNSNNLSIISDFKKSGGESGMRKWFKRHLPFKILNQGIEGLTDRDIDNPYKSIGILMWWDSKFKRVFVTKLDYTIKPKYKGKIIFEEGDYFLKEDNVKTKIDLTDSKYFKDVSWTIAYSPIYNSWISYYDFKPQYAVELNDYFNTGINYTSESNQSQKGMWAHLLTNKSYQVFYGKYYPFEIELPIKNTHTNNVLKDIKFWVLSHRYHDNFDYAAWRKKSFNKLVIHNQTNNSGLLHLNYDDSMNKSKYPISISKTEQGIQATHFDEQVMVNYYYNRVRNEKNHLPIWKNDVNEIHKTLNEDAISFNSKKVLERMRGDWFLVHLIQDSTSQFKQIFKWMVSRETPY